MSNCSIVGILDKDGYSQTKLYRSLGDISSIEVVRLNYYGSEYSLPKNVDIILTAQHYEEPEVGLIIKAVRQDIPVLILADGILEFRNTWHNPLMSAGRLFQPVLGHKIATIGRSQTRILESWGNLGKCETVGLPRLDSYLNRRPRIRRPSEPFKVLVTTAKKPGFTNEQVDQVKQSLLDLQKWFNHNPVVEGMEVNPVWRLTEGLDIELGVRSQIADLSGQELSAVLEKVDALITTPSTSMLEGMLQGIPVALLDYTNSPHFVPAAWSITCSSHIPSILKEIVQQPATRMLYQDTILHDALECRSPSIDRLQTLISRMVDISRRQKLEGKELVFPDKILWKRDSEFHFPEERFNMKTLFPEHPTFSQMDTLKLQVEIEHLKRWQLQSEDKMKDLKIALEGMQSSRFWQLREKWLALKRLLRFVKYQ
ncbi:hypothetical protein PN498_05355 [Oscillatoria sp. CS-180]|uniref:hypothetical protein n=1 Tax=Oscillatoria sp. CS-180 TaxID=3021720 RepID=UPI00232D4D39|nr:hypothetical protein [Oscillatoria sp. CS-180]MDB9525404.1 hypothetical protein [Oscillatoria sp. CS-180]